MVTMTSFDWFAWMNDWYLVKSRCTWFIDYVQVCSGISNKKNREKKTKKIFQFCTNDRCCYRANAKWILKIQVPFDSQTNCVWNFVSSLPLHSALNVFIDSIDSSTIISSFGATAILSQIWALNSFFIMWFFLISSTYYAEFFFLIFRYTFKKYSVFFWDIESLNYVAIKLFYYKTTD